LRGVDLDVSAGESVALLGPSGAGKSTVLSLLAGTFVPSAGQVLIGGDDIGRMDGRQLARLSAFDVSLVVQGSERNLVPYATVEQNIWFAQLGARRRRRRLHLGPRDLLRMFRLEQLADLPVGQLAAGQRQRVALTAGIASLPRLLLLDEPTSRLDPASRDEIIDMALRICAQLGATVIMVTHDAEAASRMARTVTIRDGRVGSEGRQGVDYAVVGRDGLLQLPQDVLDLFPPNSLVEVARKADGVELRRAKDQP
jgi:ABC-type lipoprotein export system ATPase subunit